MPRRHGRVSRVSPKVLRRPGTQAARGFEVIVTGMEEKETGTGRAAG